MTKRRPGYTLFEVILTMAILAIGAAMVAPSLESFGGETRVLAGADMVKGRLAEARARAVEEGRSYRFEIVDATHCRIVADTGDAGSPGDATQPTEGGDDTLPRNVHFVIDESNNGGAAVQRVVFQADGTARDDAEIRLAATGARSLTLKLRAITATTCTVRPAQENSP
jgi:prepilin-type N-terminal cleavage/methylation domain-containing protein